MMGTDKIISCLRMG